MKHLHEMGLDEIKKLSCDEDFLKKLFSAKDNKEVKEVFKEKDLEISDEEIEVLKENLKKSLSEQFKNMSDEELEKISGGDFDGSVMGAQVGAGVGAVAAGVGMFVPFYKLARKSYLSKVEAALLATSVAFPSALVAGVAGLGVGIGVGEGVEDALKTKAKTKREKWLKEEIELEDLD